MRHFQGPALHIALALACFFAAAATAPASETGWTDRLQVTGWAEAIRSMRLESPNDAVTSRIGTRIELRADMEAFYGFVSVDGEKNWQIDGETGVELHEAWIEHAGRGWDVRLGRQIIIWGKADGVQITDIISPPDYTESITRNLDEIRMPVDAAKFRLLGEHFDTELIWIPVFRAAVLPAGKDNPWAVSQSLPAVDEPDPSLENSEIALKVSGYFSGFDAGASVFYTWDDTPAYHRTAAYGPGSVQVAYAPEYHRLTVFGLEFSKPWSDFVFRGEAAYYKGRYHETAAIDTDPVQKNSLKWLGGVDWSPGGDWTIIAQITGDEIFDHQETLIEKARILTTTLNVTKKLLHQTLTLSGMLYYQPGENEIYARPQAQYDLTDAVHLYIGADLFWGSEGDFGIYEENRQVWAKVKYTF